MCLKWLFKLTLPPSIGVTFMPGQMLAFSSSRKLPLLRMMRRAVPLAPTLTFISPRPRSRHCRSASSYSNSVPSPAAMTPCQGAQTAVSHPALAVSYARSSAHVDLHLAAAALMPLLLCLVVLE